MKRIYFKGLAEIRAIAAMMVLFHHIELYKHINGFVSVYGTSLKYGISNFGKNGVFIFFVLSGFLITYLLLAERAEKNRIDVRKFYKRRILRIWPLYYFIVFLSFVIIPLLANNIEAFQNERHFYRRILLMDQYPYSTLLLFLFFLPNLALKIRPAVVGAAQSWSVGVEEQFYLIWPHLFNLAKNKVLLFLILLIICFVPFLPMWIRSFDVELSKQVRYIINLIPIHYMATGAIGAFVLFYYENIVKRILSNYLLFLANTIIFVYFLFADSFIRYRSFIFGFVVMIEILYIIQPCFKWNLRNKYLERIGGISYGVYMYHPFIMYMGFATFNSILPIEGVYYFNLAIYSFIICVTLLVSHISYQKFEKIFIGLKNRKYTIVQSGKESV